MRKTVLFDMDGTLFDSEKLYRAGWESAGISDELYYTFVGMPLANILKTVHEKTGQDAEKIYAVRTNWVNNWLDHHTIEEKPGMEDCLKWLKENGYHTAICTSSDIAVADRYVDSTDTRRYFDLVYSGKYLEHGKPAPDIWFNAASQLGVPVSDCTVVEDSWNGVRSGYAAGMPTVLIPDIQPVTDEMREKATVILQSLDQLPAYLIKA